MIRRTATLFAALALSAALLTPTQAQSTQTQSTTTQTTPVPFSRSVTSVAPATHRKPKYGIGPTIGTYLPTDSKTRDRFGSSWFSLGLGFGPISGVPKGGALGLDLNVQYQKHDDNHIFLAPVGVGYRVGLGHDPAARTAPYAGISGDVVFADVRSVRDNVHSGFRTGGGGAALLGVNFGNSGNIEARYQALGKIKTFNFSGLSLSAGYRF